MPIPDYQTVMLPLLEISSDGKEHYIRNAIEDLSARFKLSEPDRKELLPSGTDTIFDNRVGWARTYLKKGRPNPVCATWVFSDHGSRPDSTQQKARKDRRCVPSSVSGISSSHSCFYIVLMCLIGFQVLQVEDALAPKQDILEPCRKSGKSIVRHHPLSEQSSPASTNRRLYPSSPLVFCPNPA